ncbi:bifunctional (p)ppGpp synthetase/guanosine-3',5'-bis(diphosphate) 3'-pyrophosphohydrolase [Lentimicrobium sp. L6]|uniref:RelA/SpoT family protein n=1 Tax=Lentimicrobium sp. L6 TaxID=2735916 RepID=UPI001554EB38|nr:TGS domain-containing protein [Lentimicrobium sp. L6]NPD84476.1 bifunctional (p)ppGpp synthetase/guanosine-3',5'-bis(diphosphate) 3'-pyrophosphohydrolase [Lentimicrobium sp. L6]
MKRLEPFINYIDKVADEKGATLYKKVLKEFDQKKVASDIYQGIPNMELMLGMKSILQTNLKTQSNVFTAATLAFIYPYKEPPKEVKDNYGEEIHRILEGVQKVRAVKHDKALGQADMQRQLVLSLARDTRSLLILLSASHYLLRNYEKIQSFEQKVQVLNGAITVFIPIAHRLGFYVIKSEMEDLVLSIQEPEIYDSIKTKLAESEKERNKIINKFIAPLIMEMNAQGLQYKIKSRLKSINSIYTKMQKQNIPFEKVYDLWAIRLILDSDKEKEKETCWHAYSIVTNLYESSLSRMRDWITMPKGSGYESLHTTVKDEDGRWTEVQIRTARMDEEAENGMAAHWRYKGGKGSQGIDFWLSEIRKAIGDESKIKDSGQIQPDKFTNEVFVFTPGGDLKKLKYGATVLDFAYSIHSEVGNKCINAQVNGKVVPIKHVLRNGDQVSIITSKNQKPSVDWINFVASSRTKTKIRKALDVQRTIDIKRGKEILERKFKNWKLDFNQNVIDELVHKLKLREHYELFQNIALEKIDPLDLKKLIQEEENEEDKHITTSFDSINDSLHEVEEDELESSHQDVLVIDKIDGINFQLAKCCSPIQGDKIFGFVTVTKGISVHRNTCPNAAEMRKRYPYRIIEAKWRANNKKVNFKTSISILGTDTMGQANRITQVISNEMKVNIISMNFISKGGLFEGKVGLLVQDSQHLEALLEKLKSINGINQVFRLDS